jgi:uncharacterized protein (DUF849 family)
LVPLIIEAAINGATLKAQNPNVPRSVEEISSCACACIEAGATIVHHHTDDSIIQARHDALPYREAWTRIRQRHPDAILYPTMGSGGSHTNAKERYAHIEELAGERLLQLAIIDPGSVSLGPYDNDGLPMAIDFVYQNTFADVRYMADACCARGIGAHVSIFEPGFLRVALDYHRAGRFPRALKIQLYFGGPALPFGLPPTEKSLDAYLAMLEGTNLPWMVGVLGGDVRHTLAELAIRRGGHVRVGLEDHAGDTKPSNEDLVADIVAMARQCGRPIASLHDAAHLIGLR